MTDFAWAALLLAATAAAACCWIFWHVQAVAAARRLAPVDGCFAHTLTALQKHDRDGRDAGAGRVRDGTGASRATDTAQTGRSAERAPRGRRMDELATAAAAGTAGLHQWFNPDPVVLEAFSRYRQDDLENGWELWQSIAGHGKGGALDIGDADVLRGIRGHLGEQVAADHLSQAGHSVGMPDSGSNPGWDVDIDGAVANVKVTADGATTAAEHFIANPDIPIILNADAAHIPDSALFWDGQGPLELADLAGPGSVIVDQGLSASDLVDQVADAIPAIDPLGAVGDLGDALPSAGAIVAAALSARREHSLVRDGHTTKSRAVKNVAVDGGSRAAGFWAGAQAGAAAGAAVDGATAGATLGLGTVFGGLLGGIAGARAARQLAGYVKLAPLRTAADTLATTATDYRDALEEQRAAANSALALTQARGCLLVVVQALLSRRMLAARAHLAVKAIRESQQIMGNAVLVTVSDELRDRATRLDPLVFGHGPIVTRPVRRAAARHAVKRWESLCMPLAEEATRGRPESVAAFWDHMCVAPAGRQAMAAYVDSVDECQKGETTACQAAAHEQFLSAVRCRAAAVESVRRIRHGSIEAARDHLAPMAEALARLQSDYEREARAAGVALDLAAATQDPVRRGE